MPRQSPAAAPVCSRCGFPAASALGQLCPRCLWTSSLLHQDPDPFLVSIHPAAPEGQPVCLPARLIAGYELLQEIARGGMGVVYRARHISLNRIVALKVLAGGPFASPEFSQRFRAEAETVARLKHPNIVTIHEVGEAEGVPYFTMDFVEGPNLAERARLHPFEPFDPYQAAACLETVARAVSYAHSQGVLHRDLKPTNILLDLFGQPQITDFGLAKRLESSAQPSTLNSQLPTSFNPQLTLTGHALGSPGYAAPEQIRSGQSDPKTDIYGLGATLYHLLTGRPPFTGATPIETLRAAQTTDPVRPRALNPQTPLDLETICLKCLEKDSPKRYSTVQSLADDLQHFLKNKPISARPVGATGKVIRWSQRNAALATAYFFLLLLLLIILLGSPLAAYRINQSRKAEANARVRAETQSYISDLGLAQRLWDEGDLHRARVMLQAQMPAQGKPDLRGFEWRYLWNLCRDESRRSFTASNGINYFAWTRDWKNLAVSSSHTISLLSWQSDGRETELISDPDENISMFEFCPVLTNLLATACESGDLKLWDLETKKPLSRLSGLNGIISGLAFSADGRYLAAAGQTDRKIGLWDVVQRTNVWFRETAVPPQAVIFAGQEQFLISGGGPDAGNALIWDSDGNATPFPAEHKGWVERLVLAPNGKLLATSSTDGTTIIWDLPTRVSLRRLRGSGGAAFSPFL